MATLESTAATAYDVNVQGEYNILNDCKYIVNRDRCIYDSNTGYEVIFTHGLQGWDTYTNWDAIYAKHFLWGPMTAGSGMLARSESFDFDFEADYFTDFELDMLIRYDSSWEGRENYTELTAKLQWKMVSDGYAWREDSVADFTVYPDGIWHRYKINLLEEAKWVGRCYDFRVSPIVDGVKDMEVFIRRMAFTSDINYRCTYPPCAYSSGYKHPCPAIGTYSRAYSDIRKNHPVITDDTSRIGVSIDGYPAQYIDLDLNLCTDPHSIAQSITIKLNTLSFGGYKFALCTYNEINENFSIYSGTVGQNGSVAIYRPTEKDATIELGFFDENGNKRWYTEQGINPVDGFLPAYYRLPATILYRLPNADTVTIDYDPSDPLVEIGRNDLRDLPAEMLFEEGCIEGFLMVDMFGKCSYYGTITTLQYLGALVGSKSKILLLRPVGDYQYEIIYSTSILSGDNKRGSLYEKSISWEVRPGDVFGLYMCQPAIHSEAEYRALPEQIYKFSWIETRIFDLTIGTTISFNVSNVKFFGYEGLPAYGFSSEKMLAIGIDAELRWEYGVSQVALIGESDSDFIDVDLMELDSTKIQVKSSEGNSELTSAPDMDLMLEFQNDTEQFYIDFWFPGFMKDIYKTCMRFEDSHNLRAFCWEGYMEPEVITTARLLWGQYYAYPTEALSVGSEKPWMRLTSPYYVALDGANDVSQSLYLQWNYVTNDPEDRYPALSITEAQDRAYDSEFKIWNKLEQEWYTFHTRAMRLNCWAWNNARFRDIEIWTTLSGSHTLIHAVDAVGISGPEVFSTENYNIVDLYGDLFSTSRISRAETTDYTYGLAFWLQSDDIALAPVGTTLRKLQLDVSGLRAKIKQVKLIPQKLSVQVRTESGEPLTEISNLNWALPSDGSEYTYGPAKKYSICNDTGFKANLILGIADHLSIDHACVFSSDLKSQANIDDPLRGMPAKLISSPDYQYCNHKAINYHATAYAVVEESPVNWYSSSTSGMVWQTLTSGNPFYDVLRWNEPKNPYHEDWHVYNIAKAEDVSISGGYLSMSMSSRTQDAGTESWDNPTYFMEVDLNSTFFIDLQVPSTPEQISGIDVSTGLVMFDNTDRTKYIRIDRYSGNDASSVSGVDILPYKAVVPHGDYISYGSKYDYTISGVPRPVIPIEYIDQPILIKISKEAYNISVGWRYSQLEGQFTTVSSFDISTWSDQIRIGAFTAAIDVTGDTSHLLVESAIDYLSYKYNDFRSTDRFDYIVDFNEITTQTGRWSEINAESAEIFRTGPEGLRIKRWLNVGVDNFFDENIYTPALMTEWGSPNDYSNISMRISDYTERMVASGIFSVGMLVRDQSAPENYIKFALGSTDKVRLDYTNNDTAWTALSSAVNTTSGIWLKMQKVAGIVISSYSLDGYSYTVVSGISIKDWNSESATELIISSDILETQIGDIDLGGSRIGATHLVAEFDPPIPAGPIYGTQVELEDIQYSSSTLEDFSSEVPDLSYFIKFKKPKSYTLDLAAIKFMPNLETAVELDHSLAVIELPKANERLYDRAGEPRVIISDEQGQWSDSASFQGLPMYDAPLLVFDLGRIYEIGRCPYMFDKAYGRFSQSNYNLLSNVDWNNTRYDYCGFDYKCELSASDECTVSRTWKPMHLYNKYDDVPGYYYPGTCNGQSTEAGKVSRACPWYSRNSGRWWLLESKDYLTISTNVSGSAVWSIPPIHANPRDYPISLTDQSSWWSTSYGQISWSYITDYEEYCLVYSYPGLNIGGSFYFNGYGSSWWRLPSDREWTAGDKLALDLSLFQPENINSIELKIGRDPKCYWLFTITGTLTEAWSTHELEYNNAQLVMNQFIDLEEPSYTINDIENYEIDDLPYGPMPFVNLGYVEVTVSGHDYSDIYMKNLRHVRGKFSNQGLYLGLNESLYIPDLDLTNTGTIEFDYYPNEIAMGLRPGEPRDFLYSVITVSNENSGIAIVLNKTWGWNIYAFTPLHKELYGFLPSLAEAQRVLPSLESGRKPGPFSIMLSWAPNNLPGLDYNVVLWVDKLMVCYGTLASLGEYFDSDDIEVTLGRGATVWDPNNQDRYAAYATFSNLKIYKRAVGSPYAYIDSESSVPENLFELSSNGTDWKTFKDGELPLYVHGVETGDCVDFWMRNRRPKNDIKKLHKRSTAYLAVKWEVTGIS